MKTLLTLLLTLFVFFAEAQFEGKTEITKQDADNLGNIKTKGIKFGVSLGLSHTLDQNLYEARISPIDSKLFLEKASKSSFLISTSLSFPILNSLFSGAYYRKTDTKGTPVGDPYFVPSGLNLIATVNLVTFNSALGGAGLFNQKLDGGLGLGYTFGDNAQIALAYEMISYRQPREFIKNLEGKTVVVNNQTLSDLPLDNNNYFIDKYIPSISLKIIYTIN